MIRHILIAAVAALCVQPCQALDMSAVRCEDPQLVKVIAKKLKESVVDGGNKLSSYGAYVDGISRSTTVLASRNKLVCEVWVQATAGGSSNSERGRVVLQQFSSGKLTLNWTVD